VITERKEERNLVRGELESVVLSQEGDHVGFPSLQGEVKEITAKVWTKLQEGQCHKNLDPALVADLEQLKISPFSLSLAMLRLFFADHARSFLNWKEKML
jgi:hypothetical protein